MILLFNSYLYFEKNIKINNLIIDLISEIFVIYYIKLILVMLIIYFVLTKLYLVGATCHYSW